MADKDGDAPPSDPFNKSSDPFGTTKKDTKKKTAAKPKVKKPPVERSDTDE